MKLDLVARGNPVMDILHTKDGQIMRSGGSATTVALTVSKVGLKSGVIGRVGYDEYGKQLINELKQAGVDTSRIRMEGATDINHIRVSHENREFISNRLSYVPMDEADFDYIKKSRCFFGHLLVTDFSNIVKFCEKNNINVFTTFQRVGKDTPYSKESLNSPAIKIIFASEEEIEDWVTEITDKLVVVTQSRKGCIIFCNAKPVYFSAYAVQPIDPTGAGDVFAGAFIFGYLKEWTIDKAATFANKLAALSTTQYGARTFISSFRGEINEI